MYPESKRITLGTVQLGMNYGISNKEGKPSISKAYEILDAAVKGGVVSFDTAAGYGDSEVILGNYFTSNKAETKYPKIITKISLPQNIVYSNSIDIKKTMISLVEKSLLRLKNNSIYCIMLHNASNLHNYQEKIVEAMNFVKSKKLVEKIGVSIYTQDDVEEFLKYDSLDSIQVPINLMDLRLVKSGAIELLKKKSIKIYARSLFLQGLFFMNPKTLPAKLEPAKKYINKLNEISYKSGLSIAEIAFGYIWNMNQIDNLVIGADNAEQVKDNLEMVKATSLEKKYVLEIQDFFANVPEQILNPLLWK